MPVRATYASRPAFATGRGRLVARACAIVLLAAAAGCSTRNEVLPYPDMTAATRPPPPGDAMTPAEKEAAISELRAEAQAQASRGL